MLLHLHWYTSYIYMDQFLAQLRARLCEGICLLLQMFCEHISSVVFVSRCVEDSAAHHQPHGTELLLRAEAQHVVGAGDRTKQFKHLTGQLREGKGNVV